MDEGRSCSPETQCPKRLRISGIYDIAYYSLRLVEGAYNMALLMTTRVNEEKDASRIHRLTWPKHVDSAFSDGWFPRVQSTSSEKCD